MPELKPGKYTVEIGLAELEFDRPGQRSFDILCGDKVLATNLDLFVAAGGMRWGSESPDPYHSLFPGFRYRLASERLLKALALLVVGAPMDWT